MITPRDALRMHVDLRDRLENPNGVLAQYLRGFVRHQYDDERATASIAETVGRHLQVARTYMVEPKMIDVTTRRAEDPEHFVGTEQFGQFEAPFALGFCAFGTPLDTIEVRGRIQKVVALTWGPAQARFLDSSAEPRAGRFVVLWTNVYLAPDQVHEEGLAGNHPGGVRPLDEGAGPDDYSPREYAEFMQRVGGWAPSLMDFIPHDARIGPPRIEVPMEKRQLAVIRGASWAREGTTNYARVCSALWELMGETLSTASTPRLDRATQRWAARRAKISTDITVLTLRREARPVLHPGSGKPLEYRVPVHGHPRTYHRGTPDEFTIHISDHWRGPKDAPIRANRKVTRLAR
jgi:hypothetical protein